MPSQTLDPRNPSGVSKDRCTNLRLPHELEGNAGEALLLLVDGLVPPVVENDAVLAVVGEWLLLVRRQGNYEGSEQPSRALHPEMAVIEISSSLQSNSITNL